MCELELGLREDFSEFANLERSKFLRHLDSLRPAKVAAATASVEPTTSTASTTTSATYRDKLAVMSVNRRTGIRTSTTTSGTVQHLRRDVGHGTGLEEGRVRRVEVDTGGTVTGTERSVWRSERGVEGKARRGRTGRNLFRRDRLGR